MKPSARTERRAVFSGTRALVIDDDVQDAWSLAATLQRLGFRARMAGNGMETRAFLPAANFDWLFCDVTNECELETIRSVRRHRPWIRVVALVSGGNVENLANAASALEQGANDFLVKPIQTESLALIVLALRTLQSC